MMSIVEWSPRIIRCELVQVNGPEKKFFLTSNGATVPLRVNSTLSPKVYIVLSLLVVLALVAVRAEAPSDKSWRIIVFPSGAEFGLEIATDDASRARGYMFREQVGPEEGMLFVFAESALHSFWMKNCKVSLDIIWLDDELRVVDIARDRKPCPVDGECPSILPVKSARYVLEVAGGTTTHERLQRGDALILLGKPIAP